MNDLDAICRYYTAFASFADLLDAPRYRPSVDISQPDLLTLADAYDQAQAERGDDRRAYRYGMAKRQPTPPSPPPAPKAPPVPVTVAEASRGRVWANQAKRAAVVLGIADGLALIEYEMPAGRTFLWEVPADATWRQLSDPDNDGRYIGALRIRNIQAKRAPKRWHGVLAEAMAEARAAP
jgi:hypothetical protein